MALKKHASLHKPPGNLLDIFLRKRESSENKILVIITKPNIMIGCAGLGFVRTEKKIVSSSFSSQPQRVFLKKSTTKKP